MLLGDSETLYLFERLQEEHGWSNVPSEATLHDLRRSAEDLSGRSAAEQVAAIFFAFCVHESRLRDGANLFPFMLTCAQMQQSGVRLASVEDYLAMRDLQDEVAEGSARPGDVRAWFQERLQPI